MIPTRNTTPGSTAGAPIPSGVGGNLSSPPTGRSGPRSRYVNVLANQTAGPTAAKLDAPLPPPLPGIGGYGSVPAVPPASASRHVSLNDP